MLGQVSHGGAIGGLESQYGSDEYFAQDIGAQLLEQGIQPDQAGETKG